MGFSAWHMPFCDVGSPCQCQKCILLLTVGTCRHTILHNESSLSQMLCLVFPSDTFSYKSRSIKCAVPTCCLTKEMHHQQCSPLSEPQGRCRAKLWGLLLCFHMAAHQQWQRWGSACFSLWPADWDRWGSSGAAACIQEASWMNGSWEQKPIPA